MVYLEEYTSMSKNRGWPYATNIMDDENDPDWNECEFCGCKLHILTRALCPMCEMKRKKGCLIGAEEYNAWDVYVLNNATKRVVATKRLSFGKGVNCVGPDMSCVLVFKKILFDEFPSR